MKLHKVLLDVRYDTPLCIESTNEQVIFDGIFDREQDISAFSEKYEVDSISVIDNKLHIKIW